MTAREYGQMTVWVHGCMIVEMYRVYVWDVHMQNANATTTITDQNQAQARGTDTGVAKEARVRAGKNRRHRVSHAKTRRQKGPRHRHIHRNGQMRVCTKDTVITKGTDNRARAHTQKKDTDTIIGTETVNAMGHER